MRKNKSLMSLQERKMAKRLHLRDLKAAAKKGVWSDGNRIFRLPEINTIKKALIHRLASDAQEQRPKAPRHGNTVSSLRLIRKSPSIHGLPEGDIASMMRVRAQKTFSGAVRGTPGSMDHFLLARRYARRLGSLGRHDLMLDQEVRAEKEALARQCAVELKEPFQTRDGIDLPSQTRLLGMGNNIWRTKSGQLMHIHADQLQGVVDMKRPTRSERALLASARAHEPAPEL